MDIFFAQSGAFVATSIAHAPVPVRPVPVEQRVRRDPEGVIYNLLNRAESARRSGDKATAEVLSAQAERLFRIATGQ